MPWMRYVPPCFLIENDVLLRDTSNYSILRVNTLMIMRNHVSIFIARRWLQH